MNFALLLSFFCIVLLWLITWEDFKFREVRLLWFLLLFSILFFRSYLVISSEVLLYTLLNLSISFIQLAALWGYFKWIRKTPLWDVNLGWGDVAMLLALTPFFSPLNYVLFNLASYMAAVLYWVLVKSGNRTIPLAGIQAFFLSVLLILIVISKKYYLPLNYTIWLNLIACYV